MQKNSVKGKGNLRALSRALLAGICCLLLLPEGRARQQETKLDADFTNAPLKQVFAKIEAGTGYLINYARQEVNDETRVTLHLKQVTARELLTAALKNTGYAFSVDGNIIIVKRKPKTTANGKVAGTIVDEESGEPLLGATVRIGDQAIITDVDGAYTFTLLPGNHYKADVTSLGYGTKQVTDIQVTADAVQQLNISLRRAKGQLEGIVVKTSARKESAEALYVKQKNAAGVTDGISAEQIARTPDKHLGEVLKRVSGVSTLDNRYVVVRGLSERYNGSMLNNQLMPSTELNRKQFSYDIIPAHLVESMIVYKTLTPDLSAEFGGGLLSVTTRSIPTSNFLTVTAGSSYNDLTTGKPFISQQLEGREYWGLAGKNRALLGRTDWKYASDVVNAFEGAGKSAKLFSNNWGLYRMNAPLSRNGELSFGKVMQLSSRHKLGITGATGLRNTFQTQEVLMSRDGFNGAFVEGEDLANFGGRRYGLTSNLSGLLGAGYSGPTAKIELQGLYLQLLDQQLILGSGDHQDPSGFYVGYYDLTQQTRMLQSQLKGEHAIGKKGVRLNWMGSYILLNRERPDNHQFKASMLQKVDVNNVEELNIQAPFSSGISAGALRWWTKATENNYTWSSDVSVPVSLQLGNKTLTNTIKTGYTGWHKSRFFYVLNTGSKYDMTYFAPLSTAFDNNKQGEIYFSPFGDDFHRTASLHAGYAMLDQRLGKLRLVWGLRAEYYNLNSANALLDSLFKEINRGRGGNNSFDYSDINSREPNWNLFPSANLTYKLTEQMNLRAAYAKSIVRPDLREMSFFQEYDFELGGSYGSNLVRSTIMHHYDVRYEWYPGPGEVLSLSLFYKDIRYPMEIYKIPDQRTFYLRNNKAATNKGIEVELRKSLAFTQWPVVKNLTVYTNGTFLASEVTPMVINYNLLNPDDPLKVTPVETVLPKEKRPQAGASNYMLNAGAYYDTKPVSLSLSYNYVSNRLLRLEEVYTRSIFERPLTALDAQIAVRVLKRKGEIKLNISNLLNSAALAYGNRYDGEGVPPLSQMLYKKGVDVVDYSGRPGRTYSISFSYRF
ncbi:outer membrane receptor protein involved in Fe transport [Filimonas zeae]|nr:TonB-dependent receptor [Filimonas zeae]MDR6337596.1 outer membrane receptor protein involved in Fe transport [Filimonas zeae]